MLNPKIIKIKKEFNTFNMLLNRGLLDSTQRKTEVSSQLEVKSSLQDVAGTTKDIPL